MSKLTLKDFQHLSEVLKKNMNATIPASHWVEVRKMITENDKEQ